MQFLIWIDWKTIIWHLIWGIFDHMTIKFDMQPWGTETDNSTIKIKIGQKKKDQNQSKSFAKGGAQQEIGDKSSCLRAIWKFWSFICICQSGKGQKAELCCKLIDDNSAWFVSLLLFLVFASPFLWLCWKVQLKSDGEHVEGDGKLHAANSNQSDSNRQSLRRGHSLSMRGALFDYFGKDLN